MVRDKIMNHRRESKKVSLPLPSQESRHTHMSAVWFFPAALPVRGAQGGKSPGTNWTLRSSAATSGWHTTAQHQRRGRSGQPDRWQGSTPGTHTYRICINLYIFDIFCILYKQDVKHMHAWIWTLPCSFRGMALGVAVMLRLPLWSKNKIAQQVLDGLPWSSVETFMELSDVNDHRLEVNTCVFEWKVEQLLDGSP